MKRAVKYCGGCNPRYDRAALVRRLEAALGQPLLPALSGESYDEVYVICGCTARCADISALTAGRFVMCDTGDMPPVP